MGEDRDALITRLISDAERERAIATFLGEGSPRGWEAMQRARRLESEARCLGQESLFDGLEPSGGGEPTWGRRGRWGERLPEAPRRVESHEPTWGDKKGRWGEKR